MVDVVIGVEGGWFVKINALALQIVVPPIHFSADEGQDAALKAFSHARDVESRHAELYKKAINDMIADRETEYHVCQVCGYIAEDEAPERCPVCAAIKAKFKAVG